MPADVRDAAAVAAALDVVEKAVGLPDIVINNAAGNFVSPSERLVSRAGGGGGWVGVCVCVWGGVGVLRGSVNGLWARSPRTRGRRSLISC